MYRRQSVWVDVDFPALDLIACMLDEAVVNHMVKH
jgi:hypothetical protein